MALRVLVLGDIVGQVGRAIVHDKLAQTVRATKANLVIANGENIAGGSGITNNLFSKLRSYGVDLVTLGDHAFKKADIAQTLIQSERLLRPANLSRLAPGKGLAVIPANDGTMVAVITLLGRIYMSHLPGDDPFACVDRLIKDLPTSVRCVIVEIHAEATSEKVAMGHYLDGRASLVFGTHTHIPTADAKILSQQTAYITDIGMCGPYDSVLGRRKDNVIKAMSTNFPYPFDVATGDVRMCGVLVEMDEKTGRATHVERIEVAGEVKITNERED
jgi:2',3'-cyclic-nucleotide 2'-phosphodiesterase